MDDDVDEIFPSDNEPWSKNPELTVVRPQNIEYLLEIKRRATLDDVLPRPRFLRQ
jgi:hypothetical protein